MAVVREHTDEVDEVGVIRCVSNIAHKRRTRVPVSQNNWSRF
jgi:hypothetical protein